MSVQSNTPKKKLFSLALATTTALALAVVAACTANQAKAKLNFITKDAPKPGIVAKINGEEITEEQLVGENKMDLFELEKRRYELMLDLFNKAHVEKIIGAEAKKAGMSTDDYIAKNIAKGDVKISDKDYQKFVKEKRIPESQINPQIKERIMSYLQQQQKQDMVTTYIAKATKGNPSEFYLKKPKMDVKVEVGQAPTFGKKDAKVTVVEYSDFQCPFCSRGADTVTELKKKYGNKILVAFKHFPLPMHKEARPASEASMCINEQNTDKFWKYHDLLFKNQDKMSDADLEKYAKEVGADVAKFKECYGSKKYKDFVQKDLENGEKIGVKSTPTFFVNGQIISGAVPIEQFSEIIDDELAAK